MYLRARYHRTQQFAMTFLYRSNWFLYRGPLYQSIHFTLHPMIRTLIFFSIGLLFGITLYKSEAASWFRIYEMFQFQSFHMYGIIGSALVFGAFFTFVLKRSQAVSYLDGTPISIPDK